MRVQDALPEEHHVAPCAHPGPAAPGPGLPRARHARPTAVPAAAPAGPGCHPSEHLLRPEAAGWHEVRPFLRDRPCETLGLELDITGRTSFLGLFPSSLVLHQLAGEAAGQAPDVLVLGIRLIPHPTGLPQPGPPGPRLSLSWSSRSPCSLHQDKTPEKGFFLDKGKRF